MAVIDAIARKAVRLSYTDLGEDVIEAVRQRVFDTLGATLVGLATPEGRVLTRLHERMTPSDAPCPATEAARLLVGATRSTEIDDIDVASCATVGSVVVPSALAVAASLPGTGERQLAAAVIAGYDAMIRLARAIDGARVLYDGVWPSYVTAPFAAAAVTAKLHDMDEAQTARALALALARSALLWSARHGGSAFRFHALGCAAAEGIGAALAAHAGVDVSANVLNAYAAAIGTDLDEAVVLEDLADWRVLDVDTKLFPTSRQALASAEALQRMLPLPGSIDDIEQIVVHVPSAYRDMVDRPALPSGRIESMIGVQYQLALAAIEPTQLYDVLRESLPSDARFAQLVSRIQVRADPSLTERFPLSWGSRVDIRWRSGEESNAEVHDPHGSRLRRLDWQALRGKLDRILSASGPATNELVAGGRTEELMSRCRSIGDGAGGNAAHDLLQLAQSICGRNRPIARVAVSARCKH